MALGPIVGGIGLLLLTQLDASSDYVTGVLPGILVFGLGLSATVAPLTATALNSVEERHVGVASGINNGVSRVAGLLAIAVLGAVIAGSFKSTIDERVDVASLSPAAARAVDDAKQKPLGAADTGGLPADEAASIDDAVTAGSEQGFQLGMGLAGALMIVGGVIAGLGIRNPREPARRGAPRAARRHRRRVRPRQRAARAGAGPGDAQPGAGCRRRPIRRTDYGCAIASRPDE